MKQKTLFHCQSCGYSSPKWLGRCNSCGEWNTFVEEVVTSQPKTKAGALAGIRENFRKDSRSENQIFSMDSDPKDREDRALRVPTQIGELDRVLGGGLVKDSFVLIGGDPGIGKSTLLLQVADGLAKEGLVLYVSGEESIDQIRDRAERLEVQKTKNIILAAETELEKVFKLVEKLKPQVLMIDSLQTFVSGDLTSAPGSVSQVREVSARLMALAKSAGIAIWLVGHVTKEGSIAGPKVVEHMVDTVLYFEGDSGQSYRLLRTVKNRFGSARELGVFEMRGQGLIEVKNPSSLFLNERESSVPGTAVATAVEGSRPLLVEVQALVSQSPLALPRRTSVGMDHGRVALLTAILEKHLEMSLSTQDLYFNVVGGIKLAEPACDLAAIASIWSSHHSIALPSNWVFVGEVGLTGEIRQVSQIDLRVDEAKKLGYEAVVIPKKNRESLGDHEGIEIHAIGRIADFPGLVS